MTDPSESELDEDFDLLYVPLKSYNGDQPLDCSNAITQMLYLVKQLRIYFINNTLIGKQHFKFGNIFQEMVKLASEPESNKKGIRVLLNAKSGAYAAQVDELIQVDDDYKERAFEDAWTMLKHELDQVYNETHTFFEFLVEPESNTAEDALRNYTTYTDHTILADIFLIQWMVKQSFIDCGHRNTTWMHRYELSFDVAEPNVPSLAECIKDFLTDDVTLNCDDCPMCVSPFLQPCARSMAFTHFPPFLLVHLIRFDLNGNKITSSMHIDVRIKLAETHRYLLQSAILHKGTAEKGHYSTLVREGDDKWTVLLDETIVRQVSNYLAELMLDNYAYILLFRKMSTNEAQEDAHQMMMVDLNAAFGLIDNNQKQDPHWQTVTNGVSVLVGNTTEDEHEKLRDLDQEIAQIRLELEKNCPEYDINTIQRQHSEQYVPCSLGRHPYCGLENHRLACYANSVLQALYSCTRIRKYLLEHGQSGPFHRLLSDLFTTMVTESRAKRPAWKPSINPERNFHEHFRKKRPEFRVNAMHDAQEYMAILVELVHQEANAALANRAQRASEAPDFTEAANQWAYYRTFVDDSQLATLLMGQVESTLTCLTCGHKSRSWTAIWQLQLQLESETGANGKTEEESKSPLTLTGCMKKFTDSENLKDDSAPTCPRCKTRQPCTKQQSICRVPPYGYLVIQLLRFQASGKKIDRDVIIEPSLTICGQHLELSSVVCHFGSESIGHYYTLVREDETTWVQMDDEIIRGPLTSQDAANKLRSYAYLCIYEVQENEGHK